MVAKVIDTKRVTPKVDPMMYNPIIKQGYQSFQYGILTNPYVGEFEKERDWEFGFNRAYFGHPLR